jgi:hypothetical protein
LERLMEIKMTETHWGKLVDTDGDGNLEVVQTFDEDPVNYWHPDLLEPWREIPITSVVGSILESTTNKWWSGAEWLDKKLSEVIPEIESPPPPLEQGRVTQIRIKDPGANYDIPFVREQYDIEDGSHLVVVIDYDPIEDIAINATIIDGGRGYQVGQTFRVEQGFGRGWDPKNPTYTIIEITEIEEVPVEPAPKSK